VTDRDDKYYINTGALHFSILEAPRFVLLFGAGADCQGPATFRVPRQRDGNSDENTA